MKKYLKEIKKNGFEAYFVGGYVRDKIIGKNTFDVDIATNANLKDLQAIFKDKNIKVNDWCLSIIDGDYTIEITPYRIESDFKDYRHPNIVKKANTIEEDSRRRDFTVNALYEDENGQIYDFHHGLEHLKEKRLVSVQNPISMFKDDPLRILRAIRISSVLDFKIDESLEKAIYECKDLLNNVSFYRKKQELEKIFNNGNVEIIRKYKLEEYFKLNKNFIKTDTIEDFWKQIDISYYPLTKEEKNKINKT